MDKPDRVLGDVADTERESDAEAAHERRDRERRAMSAREFVSERDALEDAWAGSSDRDARDEGW
jgi:hypothetical protein